ncbi:ECF transporter S component, partial [Candidatus Bathyarchaeota archaeon]|nr:ECF transporter S component [Candidatus Bathyarchaeota archaeon]
MLKTREIALIAIMSSTGGAVSVPIGYFGNLLKGIPWLPFGSPQLLSGIHVIWLMLVRLITKRFGTATLTGAVKGFVELSLFSFHGIQVFPISIVEGLTADIVLSILDSGSPIKVAIAGGLSSSSNVLVLYLLLLQSLPLFLITLMWILSFVSGLLAGYFCEYTSRRI